MPDAVHVLKSLRGQLLSSTFFTLGAETVETNKLPSSTVDVKHIEAVIEYDSTRELKVAPKLSGVQLVEDISRR